MPLSLSLFFSYTFSVFFLFFYFLDGAISSRCNRLSKEMQILGNLRTSRSCSLRRGSLELASANGRWNESNRVRSSGSSAGDFKLGGSRTRLVGLGANQPKREPRYSKKSPRGTFDSLFFVQRKREKFQEDSVGGKLRKFEKIW